MAKRGQTIVNKISSDRITFTLTREDSNGEVLQFENYHAVGGIGPVPHRHPLQDETFLVKKGVLAITIDGVERLVGKDELVVVPKNAMHHWRNGGDEELFMISEFRPALHFEEIIETIAVLSQKGKMDKHGNPDPIQMSATLSAYYGEFFLGTMPLFVQRFLFGVLGPVLRKMFGYRDWLEFGKK